MTSAARVAILGLSMAATGAGAAAQGKLPPLPKDLPPYSALATFKTPKVELKTLPNGLELWLVPRPGFPKVALQAVVRGGRAADPKERPGLSNLLMDTVNQGTRTRSAKQVAEDIEAAGGDLETSAGADSLVASTEVLASKADGALELMADLMENATFPDGEVELAKRNAAENLREQEASPSFLAQRAMAKALFGDHPYATIAPTQASISQTSAAELRAAYAERFRPDQCLLVAVGDFASDALLATIVKDFGKWTAPSQSPLAPVSAPAEKNAHSIFLVPRAGSVQTTISLAAFGPTRRDPDYAATQVANAVYGGMFGSRLTRNIREDKGYTYSPGSSLQLRAQAGVLSTRADVRNAVTGPSLNEIDYELNRMATTDPPPEEVTSAQRYLVGTNAIFLQQQAAVAQQLGSLWVYGLPPEALGQESADIEKVTPTDVAAAGRKYFAAARDTIVTVGEEKVVREQLASFGLAIQSVP